MATTRHGYALFTEGRIGHLTMVNRLVRSATWDPSVVFDRRMNSETLERYRRLAAGGVGTIVTGDWPVVPAAMLRREPEPAGGFHYTQAEIRDLGRLPEAVHEVAPRCRIIAQLSRGEPGPEPSPLSGPFYESTCAPLSLSEIHRTVELFAEAIQRMRELRFDGVELHAAHGGLPMRTVARMATGGASATGCESLQKSWSWRARL
jgi:2,4-dienoyl-CoA reductase-like NADH-dependent reductase (Old Yellow Enzyme family)